MRIPRDIGRWFPPDLRGAAELQRRLAGRVVEEDRFPPLRVVAGADLSYDRERDLLFAAVVAFDARTRERIGTGRFTGPVSVPYVPGFLSFREGPGVVAALADLGIVPDLLLCDGQGRAHPRRLGLACHLGLALDLPTIGVAKSVLVGEYREPSPRRGAATRLLHRGEVVGLALRTRDGVRPVYVSVGHRVSLAAARRMVLSWARPWRLPEPIRAAHQEVSRMRRGRVSSSP